MTRSLAPSPVNLFGFPARDSDEWPCVMNARHNVLLVGPRAATHAVISEMDWCRGTPAAARTCGLPLLLPVAGSIPCLTLHEVNRLSRADQRELNEWLALSAGRTQVVATTTIPLYPLVASGAFDTSLYYRLNVVHATLVMREEDALMAFVAEGEQRSNGTERGRLSSSMFEYVVDERIIVYPPPCPARRVRRPTALHRSVRAVISRIASATEAVSRYGGERIAVARARVRTSAARVLRVGVTSTAAAIAASGRGRVRLSTLVRHVAAIRPARPVARAVRRVARHDGFTTWLGSIALSDRQRSTLVFAGGVIVGGLTFPMLPLQSLAPAPPTVQEPTRVPIFPSPQTAIRVEPAAVTASSLAPSTRAVAPTVARSARPVTAGYRGSLVVTSTPGGAQVIVNGRPVGVTPLTINNVPVGSRAVQLEMNGYRRWSSAVRVVANERIVASAKLQRTDQDPNASVRMAAIPVPR